MAFNWKTFQTRSITAILFAAIMLTGLFWNKWSFLVLFSLIHFGCWIEYARLVGLIDRGYRKTNSYHRYGVMLAGFCGMLYFTGENYRLFTIPLRTIGEWGGLFLLVTIPLADWLIDKPLRPRNWGHSFFGLFYLSLSLALMIDIAVSFGTPSSDNAAVAGYNKYLPALIIFSIWVNDTMAYIVGSLIGKTPLTDISPKKTWEGTIGGIFLAALVLYGIVYFFSWPGITPLDAALLALVVAVAGTLGDLFESRLKRMAGVKDSGTLMPGHGGFLDRFDSLLFAIPVAWIFTML